jgi:hypothetical protein
MTEEIKPTAARVDHALWMSVVSFSEPEGVIYCHTRPSVLPIMFMMTAEIAGGRATKGEEKCAAANTTPKDEFCIPTCNPGKNKAIEYFSDYHIQIEYWHCNSKRQTGRKHSK